MFSILSARICKRTSRSEPGQRGYYDKPRRIDSIVLLDGLVAFTLTRQPRAKITLDRACLDGAKGAWHPGAVTVSLRFSRRWPER